MYFVVTEDMYYYLFLQYILYSCTKAFSSGHDSIQQQRNDYIFYKKSQCEFTNWKSERDIFLL